MKNTLNSRRVLNKIKCREKILKASRRLFKAKGYENTTLEEIAYKAEVSKATLSNYFVNKENLLIGIAEQELFEARNMLDNELAGICNSKEKLRRVLEKFILDALTYINLARKITYLNSCKDSILYGTKFDMMKIFHDIIIEGQQNKIFRADIDVLDIVNIVMGVYFMALYGWTDIETYTQEQCMEKVEKFLNMVLKDVCV
jgi:AcrR family transcriptional regulator